MSREVVAGKWTREAKDIYNKYLKYHQGESFLFGKGGYSENKWVWVQVSKDTYTTGEVIKVSI